MSERQCDHCGASILTRRADARFCSPKCRVYAARAGKKRDILPADMASQRRFVRYTARKVPRAIDGSAAKSNDESTWSTLEEARASTIGEGVGFMLGGGFGCIDLDHAISGGRVASWAQAVLDANPNTFVEVSRSGEGFHIFGYLPENGGRKIRDGRNIEVYSRGRYIALTGHRYGTTPARLSPLVIPDLP